MFCDVGIFGLGVMGSGLALRLGERGLSVAIYNRTFSKTLDFVADNSEFSLAPCETVESFVAKLKLPRKILLLVKAGAVEEVINRISPLLSDGDTLVDAGNSHFLDTERRVSKLENIGIRFLGIGISGGKVGARHGAAVMAGGDKQGFDNVNNILSVIVPGSIESKHSLFLGGGGVGHFCKMVHNGIEYAQMQVFAEACHLLIRSGFSDDDVLEFLKRLKGSVIDGFLLDCFISVFSRQENGSLLLNNILDRAHQNGSGRWMAEEALKLGVPTFQVCEAVELRMLSMFKNLRVLGSKLLTDHEYCTDIKSDVSGILNHLDSAIYSCMIMIYSQGIWLLKAAQKKYSWDINFYDLVGIWKEGCIIAGNILNLVHESLDSLECDFLAFSPVFYHSLVKMNSGWRKVAVFALSRAIPAHSIVGCLSFYDGVRSRECFANIIEAVRDRFGSHGYERRDGSDHKLFKTQWDM